MDWLKDSYTKTEYMVPMRDGVRLYTAAYVPVEKGEYPVMMIRNPYPLRPYGKGFAQDLRTHMAVYARNKYIIVYQNVRGKMLSEGDFVDVRPYVKDKTGSQTDESSDAFDTIQWIVDNLPRTGALAVKGISYPGFYATLSAIDAHPALKAVSPQAPVTDWWMGDDAHQRGVLQYGMLTFGASFFRPRGEPTIRYPKSLVSIDKDVYDWFQERESISDLVTPLREKLPFLDQMLDHPDYDGFWKERNPLGYLHDVAPAFLCVGGFFDAEDCWGAFETYRAITAQSPSTDAYLVAGPWYHGGWKKYSYDHLSDAYFGKGGGKYYVESIEFPFFEWYLRGCGRKPSWKAAILPSAETMPSRMWNADANSRWEFKTQWPDSEGELTLYLHSRERLLPRKPSSREGMMYISDPMHPVPYCGETTNQWNRDAMAGNQKYASRRTDVLTFAGPVLEEEVKVEGRVRVHLEVSTTGTDADMVVKVIDVRPDGYHMMVRYGVMPLRYRDGFEKGKPMSPGQREEVDFSLNDIAHHFPAGHRIMVQVQSSMFPFFAMNPQTFLENPNEATAMDYT